MSTDDRRSADHKGPAASAWLIARTETQMSEFPAHVVSWVVHAPASHVIWPWRLLTVVSLAAHHGIPDAHLEAPEMTHELALVSIDPQSYPPPVDGSPLRTLRPVDVCRQLPRLTDQQAYEVTWRAIKDVCAGRLVPDVDYSTAWAICLSDYVADVTGQLFLDQALREDS